MNLLLVALGFFLSAYGGWNSAKLSGVLAIYIVGIIAGTFIGHIV